MSIEHPGDAFGVNDPSGSRANQRWIVSPYLSELPPGLWRMTYGQIGDRSARRQLRAERTHHRFVFDPLNASLVRVSAKEFQLLAQLGDPGSTSPIAQDTR